MLRIDLLKSKRPISNEKRLCKKSLKRENYRIYKKNQKSIQKVQNCQVNRHLQIKRLKIDFTKTINDE